MYATNFEYDGLKLSDFGMMICAFDSSGGIETVSSGADITFNTVKAIGSNRFKFIDSNLGDPGLFKGTKMIEDEVLKMIGSFLSIENPVGHMVTGGTDICLRMG